MYHSHVHKEINSAAPYHLKSYKSSDLTPIFEKGWGGAAGWLCDITTVRGWEGFFVVWDDAKNYLIVRKLDYTFQFLDKK